MHWDKNRLLHKCPSQNDHNNIQMIHLKNASEATDVHSVLVCIPSIAHIMLPHVLDEVDLLETLWSG